MGLFFKIYLKKIVLYKEQCYLCHNLSDILENSMKFIKSVIALTLFSTFSLSSAISISANEEDNPVSYEVYIVAHFAITENTV